MDRIAFILGWNAAAENARSKGCGSPQGLYLNPFNRIQQLRHWRDYDRGYRLGAVEVLLRPVEQIQGLCSVGKERN